LAEKIGQEVPEVEALGAQARREKTNQAEGEDETDGLHATSSWMRPHEAYGSDRRRVKEARPGSSPRRLVELERADLDLVAGDRALDGRADVIRLLRRLERGRGLLVPLGVEFQVLPVGGQDSVSTVLARQGALDRMLVGIRLDLVHALGVDERDVLPGLRRQG